MPAGKLIDRAATRPGSRASRSEAVFDPLPLPPLASVPPERPGAVPAASLIRQRRSAVDFDGRTALDASALCHLLDHCCRGRGCRPGTCSPGGPRLHAALFVHRVKGLSPGPVLLERDPATHDALRSACRSNFLSATAGCLSRAPPIVPPWPRAICGDGPREVSCHQEIAADGVFSLGMIRRVR